MGALSGLVLGVLPVIAGSTSNDERVVALRLRAACGFPPSVQCTGTLLSPRAILTAAHCISDTPLGLLEIVPAGNAAPADVPGVRLATAWTAPGADIAVLALAEPITGRPLGTLGELVDPAALIGKSVVVTGFGRDGMGGASIRLTGTSTIRAIDGAHVELVPGTALPCVGDSGGPVLLDDKVISVSSFGDEGCSISATSARVDVQRAFISVAVADADAWPTGQPATDEPNCPEDGDRGCQAGGRSGVGAILVMLASIAAARRRRNVLAIAALLLVVGCGSSKRSGGECDGGVAHGAKPPNGFIFWCTNDAGRKDGRYQEWWPNGTLKVDAHYRDGNGDGPYVAYHDSGKKKEQGSLKDGLRIGKWQEWHPDGALRRDSEYLPGGEVRFTTYYDGGGPRWVEGVMRGQKENGRFTEYAPGGTKIGEGDYENGRALDNWTFWNDDGSPSPTPRGTLFTEQ